MKNSLTASLRTLVVIACPLVVTGVAHGFIHPSVPHTLDDLVTLKANLDIEPWKTGYAALADNQQWSFSTAP